MDTFSFAVVGLAVFRLAVLVVDDEITEPLRRFSTRWAFLSQLVSCVACTSVWIGVAATVGLFYVPEVTFWVAVPFALSGIAILLDRIG